MVPYSFVTKHRKNKCDNFFPFLLSSAPRSRVLARLASLAQIGELARRLQYSIKKMPWIQNVLLKCRVRVDWNLILLIIMIIITII